MGQSPWTSTRQTPARWVVAFLVLATAFALWAVATSIVTTKSTGTSHIVVQAAQARRAEPAAREADRPLPAPPLPSATPVPSPEPVRVPVVAAKPPPDFEPAEAEPSEGPAINDRPKEPRPPDPMDFHHHPSEAVDVPPENGQ